MSEDSWCSRDDESKNTVPEESLPKRVALTATGVVTKRQSDGTAMLLLCNPHPDSWNSWMLPYGSLAMDVKDMGSNVTFGRLGKYMEDLRRQHIGSYEEKALTQVRQLVGLPEAKFDIEPELSNFSLKFSKSANVWTAYCFVYHRCQAGHDANPSVQVTWLMLNEETISAVATNKKLEGLTVADNVLLLLKAKNIVF